MVVAIAVAIANLICIFRLLQVRREIVAERLEIQLVNLEEALHLGLAQLPEPVDRRGILKHVQIPELSDGIPDPCPFHDVPGVQSKGLRVTDEIVV